MKFDVFHSIGRIDSLAQPLTDRQSFENFFSQLGAAESMDYGTIWVAESHFSSEVQKSHAQPVIPNYQGEVGLNCDSMQLAQVVLERTQKIGFGTAIMNIVGGNGGPIASADRVRTLAYLNSLRETPRRLDIGVAAGRFPYINRPFGIGPRSREEEILWPQYNSLIFVEALEIFLRLLNDETFGSKDVSQYRIDRPMFRDEEAFAKACEALPGSTDGWDYQPRYQFEPLKLVPSQGPEEWGAFLKIVLGSGDPRARKVGLKHHDLDVFNLSFTPPEALNKMHEQLDDSYREAGLVWSRQRMPRTVLVFIDEDSQKAHDRASKCFDTYIEAMRGTAKFPAKEYLMDRALIGSPQEIRDQLHPEDPHGFHGDDRLMLWFEFNQSDNKDVIRQMRLFAEKIVPHFE
jgi:alkanesulfonate monooxygenase SsuD/methylene tetrahydromethanopterin reductase-like flavin-dependent oxidoreductase (luciferase family)